MVQWAKKKTKAKFTGATYASAAFPHKTRVFFQHKLRQLVEAITIIDFIIVIKLQAEIEESRSFSETRKIF